MAYVEGALDGRLVDTRSLLLALITSLEEVMLLDELITSLEDEDTISLDVVVIEVV
jgi:hypothetical protein